MIKGSVSEIKTMEEHMFEYQFRFILIGDTMAGKSTLLKYFTDGKFAEVSDPTVGVDFFARLIEMEDGKRIKLQLWDTAGQEKFRSITKSYYRNSVGVILVYDVSNRNSFASIPLWMDEAKRYIDPHQPSFALIGCKIDLPDRQVSYDEAEAFAAQNGIPHAVTSSKTGAGVEAAFRRLAQDIYEKVKSGEYKIKDNWDGIKTGFVRPNGLDFNVAEGEPVRSSCC